MATLYNRTEWECHSGKTTKRLSDRVQGDPNKETETEVSTSLMRTSSCKGIQGIHPGVNYSQCHQSDIL